jgi:hypothetical protein
MDGSEKIKLLVIGKFQNPRCFKGITSLPVEYRWNKKAWMTSQNICGMGLIHCSAHTSIDNLKSINLQFLPPNTTSKLQPMDQRIIYNLKIKYRQRPIQYILEVSHIYFVVDS